MIKSPFLRHALIGCCVLMWALPSFATQNCVNGQLLYSTRRAVDGVTCSNSSCHGPDPSFNAHGIAAAANDPTVIFAAINGGVEDMETFQGAFTASELDDLATWIAFAPKCPSGGAALSISPTSHVFAAQDVGATSAPTTITVRSAGTLPATGVNISSNNAAEFPVSSTCGVTLSVGLSCTISVTFNPSSVGNRSATLTVDSSAGTTAIALSGVGKTGTGNTMLDVIEYYHQRPREFWQEFVQSPLRAKGLSFQRGESRQLAK